MPPFVTAHTFCASPDGPRNTGFSRKFPFAGVSSSWQGQFVSQKKNGMQPRNFRDNRAQIWKENAIHCYLFSAELFRIMFALLYHR